MNSLVTLGSLDETTWVYQNEELDIEFKLPHGWYKTQMVVESKDSYIAHSVRIGEPNDIIKVPSYFIPLSDLKKGDDKNNHTMFFSITKDSVGGGSGIDIKTSHLIAGIAFSENMDPIKDLELKKKKSLKAGATRIKLTESAIKEGLPVGDWEQPYWEAASEDRNDGIKTYGIVSLKNYGCYNFYIMATYYKESDKEEILTILKNNISTISN
ncbi:hypothetical protein [Dysgonomonas sp. 521]|uniref:hypothetical protein n=1 Tax=Dysgonomonas sp. 521 TaxID=2302932 RepID=UPI0013CF787F|nr:hypothetical protein [Dysgonomonas sp. 521]